MAGRGYDIEKIQLAEQKGEKNEETEKDFFGRAVPCDGAIIAGGCCRTVGQYSTD